MNKILLILIVSVSFLLSSSDFDKEILVVDQTRDDKVKIVFDEMMEYYKEEDSHAFFSFVSEERFIQDYMTFTEAIDKDFRKYETISFDKWIDKITSDGVKRYLYVKWEKTFESNEGTHATTRTGYSRFLFDEINGEYKLIELAGNNLWGGSLAEWTEEVPTIPGQVIKTVDAIAESNELPDLLITNIDCYDRSTTMTNILITITNNGEAEAIPDDYIYVYSTRDGISYEYKGSIPAGESRILDVSLGNCDDNGQNITFTVDPDNFIEESNENNNTYTLASEK